MVIWVARLLGCIRGVVPRDTKVSIFLRLNICQEDTTMKQRKLIEKLYRACVDGDAEKVQELKMIEFKKILKHKAEGKPFTAKWTLVRI